MTLRFCPFLLLLALVTSSPARAEHPELPVPGRPSGSYPVDLFLTHGSKLEQKHLWQQAAETYERAIRLYPSRTDLRDRWKNAERRFSLSRRYHDTSFTDELLAMNESAALDLYAEVLKKIQTYYVEPIDLHKLVDQGKQHLDLALSEAVFLDKNFSPRQREQAANLRRLLSRPAAERMVSIESAIAEVLRVADDFRQANADMSNAVVFEFISAASEGLDPYSTHLSPNRLRDLYAMIDGNFVGLGVEVKGCSSGLFISDVLPASPAEEAGLAEGDTIIEIDGKSIAGLSTEDAANRLQGQAGSIARLKIVRQNSLLNPVEVARREVVVHSVNQSVMLEPKEGIGYIRLSSFQKQTARELEEEVGRLEEAGLKSLILDLRGNPGGLLDAALSVANSFIDDGVLVSTQGRSWGQSWAHRARATKVWTFPLVVLIDGDSASASEILAGAVKDHARGMVVGTRSYGKGSVQSIFPLRSANTGLRLTTAHFYSPKGKVYQNVGVEPDITIARELGPLGEESAVPKGHKIDKDHQLRKAYQLLARQDEVSSRPAQSNRATSPISSTAIP